jgi:hypothetical protein
MLRWVSDGSGDVSGAARTASTLLLARDSDVSPKALATTDSVVLPQTQWMYYSNTPQHPLPSISELFLSSWKVSELQYSQIAFQDFVAPFALRAQLAQRETLV